MPPKPVSLAYAGRKLTGPAEGYSRKKELQVKKWIAEIPPTRDLEADAAASVASISEVSLSIGLVA